MLRIREMRPADIPFAIRLTSLEGWGIPARDFRRMLGLDARGSCVAIEGSERVGLATTTHYGRRVGWIGNVVVKRGYRQRHIGQQLVDHAVNHLSKVRVKHIALYSFKENLQFYRKLGFVPGNRFLRLRRESQPSNPITSESSPKPLPLSSPLAMDRKAFGADRARLITALLCGGYAWCLGYRAGHSASYVVVKNYKDMNEIGPWISFGLSSGELSSQLQLIIGKSGRKPIEITCPLTSSLPKILKSDRFHAINEGRVMFYERVARIGQPRAIVAYGFLDKG